MGWRGPRVYVTTLVVAVAVAAAGVGIGMGADGSSTTAVRKHNRTSAAPAPAPAYDAATIASVRAEADWILSAQLADGAIAHYPDKVRILPYVSGFASVGLARASAVTQDDRYVRAAWRWLNWYQAHQSQQGFVTDYEISSGVETSTGDMDSTDSYSGMFLYAAWTAWSRTRDRAALQALRPGIVRAVKAMEATLDSDGLTWAKPAWHVKYLMDEVEVHAGFRSAAALFSALGDQRSARSMTARATSLRSAIDALWDPSRGAYAWAVHEDGSRQSATWTTLYPDALEQTWAVSFGVASPEHGEEILNRFASVHPDWASPEALAHLSDTDPYWPVAGWAMSPARRAAAASTIAAAAERSGRAWPYHPGVAGQLIVLATGGPALP